MILTLMGMAGLAHAVDPGTDVPVVEVAELVTESPTWESGYTLLEGRDDYGYAATPNEEVAGETPVRFEMWAQAGDP